MIEDFGVTSEMVRLAHFPHQDAFSTASAVTLETVERFIEQAAAELHGKLLSEGLTASSIAADPTSASYAWCQETIAIGAAKRIARSTGGVTSELYQDLRDELKGRFDSLDAGGGAAIGVTESDTPSNGPLTHINRHSIELADDRDRSDFKTRRIFRGNDPL